MPYVDVDNGVRLFVQDVGAGPVVVLVAGFGLDHRIWDREVRVLAPRHRVLCIDQRGHGLSDKPLDGYDVERLAQDLVIALRRLDVTAATVVGWSFGGQAAFRAAAQCPELIERLVLVGSNAVRASRSADFPFGLPPEKLVPPLIAAEERDRFAARRESILSGFHRPPAEAVLDWLVSCSLSMPSWAAVACYHSMLETDLLDDIERVRVPVLQLIGATDPVHSARGARWLNERLADARLVELADCGHYPMLEAPDRFGDELLAFIDSDQTASAPIRPNAATTA
ncbi:alpha/beta fold hydrolase [Nocardia miyunensis]|uniref:alpha/beta fold hydrolase n=1 Tax=Nocardia miyunensis TaxID=282684 RepID=UPI00082CD59E|nr:alpha/beta hydrolase [Nocardia miyunensis]